MFNVFNDILVSGHHVRWRSFTATN